MADVEIDERELAEWTGKVDIVIDRLGDFFLPEDFPLDFTPESLRPLEAIVRERYAPDAPPVFAAGDFVESLIAYVGEVFVRLTGGAWAVGRSPATVPADAPFVLPDPELGLGPVRPLALLVRVGREGGGEVLARAADEVVAVIAAHPGWTAPPVPGPPAGSDDLDSWLAARERAFPRWLAEQAGGDTRYDFGVGSLEHLQELLRGRPGEVRSPEHGELVQGAAWYLGEVARRTRGGGWVSPNEYEPPGEYYVHAPERDATAFPFTGVEMTVDPRWRLDLRKVVEDY